MVKFPGVKWSVSAVPLCLNTENLVSEETMNQFNKALPSLLLDNQQARENTEKHTDL